MPRTLPVVLALAAGPLVAHAAPLSLEVAPGDTPAALLIRHARELPVQSEGRSPRALAYALLQRSPAVRGAVIHAGDRLVVAEDGSLHLEKHGLHDSPPHAHVAVAPPDVLQPSITRAVPPPDVPEPSITPVQPAEAAPEPPHLRVSDDGRTLFTPDGAQIAFAPGLGLFERAGILHVVGTEGPAFDLAVPQADPQHFALPPNPFVALSPDGARVLPAGVPSDPQPLLQRGELHAHEDHLHLTSQFAYPAWQKLYEARAEESPLEPARKQVAAALLVKLLDKHIDPDPARFALSLLRVERSIDHVWQGFQQGAPARELADGVDLDLWVSPDGSVVDVAGERYLAAPPLRFETCVGHFHVVGSDDEHRFAAKVPVTKDAPVVFPPSPFYAVAGNVLLPKPVMPMWSGLVHDGALTLRRGHYHLTPKWDDASIATLERWGDRSPTREVRDEAMRVLLGLLSTPLDPRDEDDLRDQLTRVRSAARAELEALQATAAAKGWVLEAPAGR